MNSNTLIDGGWLTYTIAYQFSPQAIITEKDIFEAVKWCAVGPTICLDAVGTEPIRRKFYKEYKVKRGVHENKYNTGWAREIAQHINTYLEKSSYFYTIKEDHLEADDIIARIAVESAVESEESIFVYGHDKDLMQLPGVVMSETTVSKAINKIYPKTVQLKADYISRQQQVALGLILFGDTADNVPRLNKPRDMKTVRKLLASQTPFTDLLEHFEPNDIWRQLNLVLLPMPHLVGYDERMLSNVLDFLDTGAYWY